MSDIMTSIGLDITDFKNSLNQLNESTQKVGAGLKGNMIALGAGVLGVAAVLTTSLMESQKNFTALTKDAGGFSDALSNIAASGGVNEIVAGLASANVQMLQLTNSVADAAGFMESIGAGIAGLFGGDNSEARIKAISAAQMKLLDARGLAESEIVRLLKIEAGVVGMREKGDDYSAAVAEERLRLEKEISALRQKSASGVIAEATADKAAAVAESKSALKLADLEAEKKKKASDEEKKRADVMDKIAEEIGDGQKKRADDAQKAVEKLGEDTVAANKRMQEAEAGLIQQQVEKMTLKDQAAIQAGKVADAEFKVAKATKGTVEWYERLAELAKERLDLENKIDERAKAYEGGTSKGRKFDRDEKKRKKKEDKGRERLDEQNERDRKKDENERNRPKFGEPETPLPKFGPLLPQPGAPARPIMQPQAPPMPAKINAGAGIAGDEMKVTTLIVGTLKSA